MQAASKKTDSGESNEDSAIVEESGGEKSRQESQSVEEILTEVIHSNKITRDSHAEQDSEDTADPDEAAAEQSKVEESHIRGADLSSDQENIVQDPNAANDSTDSEESNEKPAIVEESKQEQPSVEETFVQTSDAEEIAEDAQTEQVPEETVDPGDAAGEEQNEVEESLIQEPDISSDQDDAAADPNVADSIPENTAAAPETKEETATDKIFEAIQKIAHSQGDIPGQPETGKIFEAIRKMTQSPADLPGQPIAEEKSTSGITSGLLEISANDIMQNQVTWATPDDSLQHAFAKMQQTDAGYIMIGLNNVLEGIVSKSDITKAMSPYLLPIFAKWRRPLDDATLKIRIKWIMSRPVHTIKPQTPLATIMEHMSRFRGRCLPVMDEEGNVKGLVTAFDIFRALLKSNSNTCSTEDAPRELVETASSTETT